jgi:hypothetical protein
MVRSRTIGWGIVLLLALFMTTACSRKPAVDSVSASTSDNQQLPFERSPNRKGISPTTAIPFQGVPAGTPLKIRLRSPLSSAYSRSEEPFEAVLDEGVVVRGKILVPRGTVITGRVVTAKPSDGLQNPGYLRLTLSEMAFQGKKQTIQTSSLFRKGGRRKGLNNASLHTPGDASRPPDMGDRQDAGTQDVELSTDQRLVFRLKSGVPGQS